MDPCRVIGELVEMSRMGEDELSVEWRMRDFLSGDFYDSPAFRFGDERWWLELWPNCKAESENPASGWLWLVLNRCDGGPSKPFSFSLGIRGMEKRREGERVFKGRDFFCLEYFCSRKELMEHRARLMPDNVLNITCVLKRPAVATGVLSRPHSSNQVAPTNRSQSSDKLDACTQTDCNLETEVCIGMKKSVEKRGIEKAMEDIGKLLASGEDSDFTVQVGDVDFKVHSLILSARCPVLAAMVRHETDERASNSTQIVDCEPEIFREYLQYLYTGSVRSLTEQTVFGLYRIAKMYLSDDLKRLCLEHMRATLSVQTFCETVKLALKHGESDLLQLAVDFATRNLPLIIKDIEWQNFSCEYPGEASEILFKCIRP